MESAPTSAFYNYRKAKAFSRKDAKTQRKDKSKDKAKIGGAARQKIKTFSRKGAKTQRKDKS